MKVPRWLILQERIDYWMWELENVYSQISKRSPIEQMVDKATGFDKKLEKEAKIIMKKIDKLKAEFYQITAKEKV